MEENYLIALLVSFIFGFVYFKKENKMPESRDKVRQSSSLDVSSDSTTGVQKYLQNQQDELLQTQGTGVSKYLQEKEFLDVEKAQSLAISGVAKYLSKKEETSPSGVSRYMARQSIQVKKIAQENTSGVEKYLKNHQR